MAHNPEEDIVFNTGTGGTIIVKNYGDYVIYEFSREEDMKVFLSNTPNAQKRNSNAKWSSVWTDGKWANAKHVTYKVLVRK